MGVHIRNHTSYAHLNHFFIYYNIKHYFDSVCMLRGLKLNMSLYVTITIKYILHVFKYF